MQLVPRQLQRAGMTGKVPYYGGRFTPAQAYAAAHPSSPPASFPDPMTGRTGRAPAGQSGSPEPGPSPAESLAALDRLHETGVLTEAEYEQLRARIAR